MISLRRIPAVRIRPAVSLAGLAGVVLLVVVVCAWSYGSRLEAWQQGVLGVIGLSALIVVVRRWLPILFGPVFLYDLVNSARGGRQVWMRCGYALILLVVLFLLYSSWFLTPRGGLRTVFVRSTMPIGDTASFASTFFYLFMAVQFGVVLLLTPVYVSGAITQEKERRTLDLLLTTDLSNREIVLGMLASRLANMLLVLLTGLPILSLMELLGGVDPNLVVLGFAFTGVTLLSLGSVSILASVCNSTLHDALFRTYLWMSIFLVCGAMIPGLNTGNPVSVIAQLYQSSHSIGGLQGDEIVAVLVDYAWFHFGIILVCSSIAVAFLRKTARKPEIVAAGRTPVAQVAANQKGQSQAPVRFATGLGDQAMWWKEVSFNPPGRRALNRSFLIVSVGLIGTLGVIGLNLFLSGKHNMSRDVNNLELLLGTLLACVMILIVASVAATSISRECEQQTLDSLLATPVEREAILFAKWLASLHTIRNMGWCMAVMWSVGVVTGGLHYLAVPLLALSLTVYLAFAASLGLYVSTLYRSSMRAVFWTLLVLVILGVGPWFLGFFGRELFRSIVPRRSINWIVGFLQYGLSPPAGLVSLTMPLNGFSKGSLNDFAVMSGLVYYGLAAWGLWWAAKSRFAAMRGPAPLRQPPWPKAVEPLGPEAPDQGQILETLVNESAPLLNVGPAEPPRRNDDPLPGPP